ncbi:transglutaminase-like domain-containing protein [Sphingobacterium sp. GVS05A]|uniref:transglutaminase-like domain-containing protein n=1 Tax=Sphingobacterium sp. GVS05A TaxID=2862679 RepID=UPI001CBDD3EA|nr:transglutaminase-like domain-containing protein [Sphingobacterium sp. GVS05A]
MKLRSLFFALSLSLFNLCLAQSTDARVTAKQDDKTLEIAFTKAGKNRASLEKVLKDVPDNMKEGAVFLISYMPQRDLESLSSDFLLRNIELAYRAKEKFPWTKQLPDSIFLNEVLPYAVLNENRDEWREELFNRFSKYVESCKTLREAIAAVNKNIRDEVMVDYNTKRKRPDQSPSESIDQGMASCSGLSILLTDAFRAVGIPSRVAGTLNWFDNRGNHNWCEVWIDGKWYFTEYYPDKELNRSWFLADAGKADANNRQHAIYASSFKAAETYFPLAWDTNLKYVNGVNVTPTYKALYNEQQQQINIDNKHTAIYVIAYESKDKNTPEDRKKCNIDIFQGKDQVGGGSTKDARQDANDRLQFAVEKNKTYTLKYNNKHGAVEKQVKIENDPLTVTIFLE